MKEDPQRQRLPTGRCGCGTQFVPIRHGGPTFCPACGEPLYDDALEDAIDVTARRLVQAIDALKLERGAEPYWMQDVRLAQKRIEAQRQSLRGPRSDS